MEKPLSLIISKLKITLYICFLMIVLQSCTSNDSGEYIVHKIDCDTVSYSKINDKKRDYEFAQYGESLFYETCNDEYLESNRPYFLNKTFFIEFKDKFLILRNKSDDKTYTLSKNEADGTFSNLVTIDQKNFYITLKRYDSEISFIVTTKEISKKGAKYTKSFHCSLSKLNGNSGIINSNNVEDNQNEILLDSIVPDTSGFPEDISENLDSQPNYQLKKEYNLGGMLMKPVRYLKIENGEIYKADLKGLTEISPYWETVSSSIQDLSFEIKENMLYLKITQKNGDINNSILSKIVENVYADEDESIQVMIKILDDKNFQFIVLNFNWNNGMMIESIPLKM